MGEIHPSEFELTWLSDSETDGDGEVAEHLHWCTCCRSVVADYRWLQEEVTATLVAVADSVPVPGPEWWAVQERIFANQRRQVAGWRASAVASVVLAVCLMLSVSLSPVFGTAALAQTASPEVIVAIAPAADSSVVSGGRLASVATPTPSVCEVGQEVTPPPAFVLPPTPPRFGK